VPFSCFALPDTFSAVRRASSPVFMICSNGFIFRGNEGVRSRFHVLSSQTRFRRSEGVVSRFHVMLSWTHFQRFRGRRVPFSSFASPYSYSAVPRALDPVFMFCAPRLVFGDTEDVGSRFHILRFRTHFQRYRGRPLPFSCFELPDMFLVVRRV
jgi:hypothetical protein